MKLGLMRNPILRLAIGLVGLAGCLLIATDLLFGIGPRPSADSPAAMRAIAEIGAQQLVETLAANDRANLEPRMAQLRAAYPPLLGIAVRERSGGLMAESGAHPPHSLSAGPSPADLLAVRATLRTGQEDWGTAEFFFVHPPQDSLFALVTHRSFWLPLLTALGMVLLTYFYLRRAFSYLDPSSVVPDRLRAAFDGLTEGVVLLDNAGRVVLANTAFRNMSCADPTRIHGRKLLDAVHLEWAQPVTVLPWDTVMSSGAPSVGLYVHVGPTDQSRAGHLNCSPIRDAHGGVRGCLVTVADMTEVEKANRRLTLTLTELEESKQKIETQNKELEKLANLDPLTGLLNRRRFFELANEALRRCHASKRPLTMFMLDIDHFKSVNDRHGHPAGDAVIRAVAECLGSLLGASGLVCRYGGEEFCVLCEALDEPSARELGEKVRARIETLPVRGAPHRRELRVTVSIGLITTVCAQPSELSELLNLADTALYRAKKDGRNRVAVAPAELDEPEVQVY